MAPKNREKLSDELLLPVDISERFSRILVDTVGTDRLKSWVKANRGAMVLCRSGSGLSPLDSERLSLIVVTANR